MHPTSVYRRWGTLEALVLAVAVARVSAASPMPDTGTLRSDLLAYAHQAAHDLAQPDGLAFLRAVISTVGVGADVALPARLAPEAAFLASRGEQIQAMLDRAAGCGEPRLHYTDVLDVVLAPLYLRALFGVGGIDDHYLQGLVERLMTATPRPGADAGTAPSPPCPECSQAKDVSTRVDPLEDATVLDAGHAGAVGPPVRPPGRLAL